MTEQQGIDAAEPEAGKGLRVLSAYDANGDGCIDVADPVYNQLRIWRDLNRDRNNTCVETIGALTRLAPLPMSARRWVNKRIEKSTDATMKRFPILQILGLVALLTLQGCASSLVPKADSHIGTSVGRAPSEVAKPGIAPIPGGYWMYSYGPGQTHENFTNVEIAQYNYGLWSQERSWVGMGPTRRASGNKIGLQAYYPLHVRWKLKDGREYIAENIDVAAIMREYFKTKNLQLQWQREGRSRDKVGDAEPLLAHEVKDDGVILKWVITINRTPVQHRLTSTGAATRWDTYDEEHVIAIVKGVPTSGIDFSKTRELREPAQRK